MVPIHDEIHTHYLLLALTESLKCQPKPTAFSVGCVLTVPSSSSALHALLPPVLVNAFPWTWTTQNACHTSTDRRVLSTGYSRERERDERNTHAEANAVDKAIGLVRSLGRTSKMNMGIQPQPQPQPGGYGDGYGYGGDGGGSGSDGQPPRDTSESTPAEEPQIVDVDLYTTLEPCSERTSGLKSCAQTILDLNASAASAASATTSGFLRLRITRVFIGAAEPPDFVVCAGARLLSAAGVEVVWLGERKVRLSDCDLVELVQPGRDPGEEIDLASVCLRAARRGNE